MFERWYALDPGAFEMRLYDYSKEKTISLRSCTAYKGNSLLALSNDSLEYVYHQSPNIQVKYPIIQGKIQSDVTSLIAYGLKELGDINRFYRPCLLICLPQRNHPIENEWIVRLSETNIKKIEFISIADILDNEKFLFYIHAGHSYTQIGFLSKGNEIFIKDIPFSGQQMDEMVQRIVTEKTQCLISNEDARMLKEAASKHLINKQNAKLSCFGMNRYQQYIKIEVMARDLWPALESVEKQIVLWTKHCLSQLSLEYQEQIVDHGIQLSGGLANCFGLKQYLEHEMHTSVICTNHPECDIIEKMEAWK